MGLRLSRLASCRVAGLAAGAALFALAGLSGAQAFTFENGSGASQGGSVPKFDIEEQARNFRSGSDSKASGNKHEFEGPFGKGTFQFDVQSRPMTNFGSGFGTMPGFNSRVTRQDMDRMLAPPGLQHRFDQ